MQKRLLLQTVMAASLALGFALPAAAQNWKPSRPINLIVPWAAGGSTDQVTRVAAAELENIMASCDSDQIVCERLVEEALARGASDNVSVIVCTLKQSGV